MDVGHKAVRGGVRPVAVPVVGLVLLALVLAGCASAAKHHAAAAPKQPVTPKHPVTTTVTFHAYDPDGQLAIKVGDVASGRCWTMSIAAPVADAYRCFAANQILDPCFAPQGTAAPRQVACVATPWSRAVVLHLTTALPHARSVGEAARAWAFRLDNGVRCVASTGTVPAVQGVDLGYHCTDGRDAALLDRHANPQTADYGDADTNTLQSVTVTTVWVG